MTNQRLKVALAQIAPVWLDRDATIQKVIQFIERAGKENADLVAFGEAVLPGYPFWLDWSGGANFNHPDQKQLFAHYASQSVSPERGDLDAIYQAAARANCMVILGTIEAAKNRGGHSLYCSLAKIDRDGTLLSMHRKLMPTYDERLVWSPGDGHGLQVHPLGDFQVGALNCWENWMPLPRAALYAQGEDLHVAIWPGSFRNTHDITPFIAKESRSYVLSVSGMMRREDIHDGVPQASRLRELCPDVMTDGGSCLAAPDGTWVIEPVMERDVLRTATIDLQRVLEERQNFDASGHYSRPDVTKLVVDRRRQQIADFQD